MQAFLDARPDAVIIANPTKMHVEYITQILPRNIHILVEKPLVANIEELQLLQDQLVNYTGIGMTAYNMHFHPCVRFAKKILGKEKLGKIYSARFFVGQYLPDWRPDADYSKSYSASREMGGGVLFDLIHEIDLACFLVGEPVGRISCQVDKVSDLQIETEDLAELLYRTDDNSFVSIHLDYLTRGYQRYIEIIGSQSSLWADLFSNKVTVTSESGEAEEKFFPEFSKNDMYLDMLSGFINCINKKNTPPASLQYGLISNQISINIRNEFYHGNA
jgi:predicted dehydrogenase